MLKLRNLLAAALAIIIFCGVYYFFSKPQMIEWLSGWLQLLISGGVITPLASYAWLLKGRFEKLIDTDDLTSIELERLNNQVSLFINKIWKIIFFYIICACLIALFIVVKNNFNVSRWIAAFCISFLFLALISAIVLKSYDTSLIKLKAAIKIRKKKKEERAKMLCLLQKDDIFSDDEKNYFNNYNNEETPPYNK
ncbi:hypothetical protein [Enterobacter roggenkampii]|uniref:hypothetical protein n=2 Tax=Enterobacter TaxID=547 RepID=UPI0020042EB1|nr:hypothetical protein [Enterobacter roggenkampii]EGS2004519.1 hypothetical protein [Enterobacter cloacae]MCK7408059.1 hypothetical protein [Enterobacter roggenkampii]MEB5888941.1 hypothetical protein [Enterobacter roggenkampii]WJS51150.1 hypothetical protein QU521_00380 [Enterobacter roggenkampii]